MQDQQIFMAYARLVQCSFLEAATLIISACDMQCALGVGVGLNVHIRLCTGNEVSHKNQHCGIIVTIN